jgi:hypothetical protein
MKPLCIDLFCGYGGWARGFLDAGYRVIGFDIEPRCAKRYPGEFVLADVRSLDGKRFVGARMIVASPPCQGFSLAGARWHRPPYGFELWDAAVRIGKEAGVPLIIENVRGAIRFYGTPAVSRFPWYLWGDVPAIVPTNLPRKWNAGRYGGKPPEVSAIVPYPLARQIAEACLP